MASKIRIHRSTGASAPSSLEFGELAATVEQGTAGNSANKAVSYTHLTLPTNLCV